MDQETREVINRWHDMMSGSSHDGLLELLAEDCIFWSPVVHTPQRGRDITYLYLSAASQVFGGDFRYVSDARRQPHCARVHLHHRRYSDQRRGYHSGEESAICEFKVMVRPLKAVNKVHERMIACSNIKGSTDE